MNKNKIIKEACIESISEAKYFIKKEVDRFETCYNLAQGGLTPKVELFNFIKKKSNINQVVMIRTNDNFSASSEEIELMIKQIKIFRNLGAKEFIFGFINDKNEIDVEICEKLIMNLDTCKYSFHMAIDSLGDYDKNIPILIQMGFSRLLTKGGEKPAIENVELLRNIILKYGNEIEILVGGSVTKDNYEEIIKLTNATQVHGTKIA